MDEDLLCSATLDFILSVYFGTQEKVINYREAMEEYIEFNEKVAKFPFLNSAS